MYLQNSRTDSLSVIRSLLCLLATVAAVTSHGHSQLNQRAPEVAVQKRIAALMNATLGVREKITPEDTKLWLRVPPPAEAIEEVKAYGDRAVAILAEYLRSGNYHDRELAMEFLSRVGGASVVEPLLTVIRYDPEPRLREAGLEYLSKASWDAAAPTLREAWKADPDPRVRQKAKYILESHEAQESKSRPASFVRKRIAALMGHILKKGEGVLSDGSRVWTASMAHPSNEDVKEIKNYGDRAVPILSEYLTWEDGHRKNLAMRFLGILGGSRIVAPLERVILNDPSPGVRETALRYLTSAPWESASPILQQAAQDDPDPAVRQTARELLEGENQGR
jgi:HEAT repeat protein